MRRLFTRGGASLRSRVLRVGLVLAAVGGFMVVPSAPASATGTTTIGFTGTMSAGSFPPGVRNWSMNTSSCYGADASATTPTSTTGPLCGMAAAGTVSGPCASATGSGTMYVYVYGLTVSTIEIHYSVVQTATTVTLIGTAYHHGTGEVGTMEGHGVLVDWYGGSLSNCLDGGPYPVDFITNGTLQISFP